jgi:hypothetical protein
MAISSCFYCEPNPTARHWMDPGQACLNCHPKVPRPTWTVSQVRARLPQILDMRAKGFARGKVGALVVVFDLEEAIAALGPFGLNVLRILEVRVLYRRVVLDQRTGDIAEDLRKNPSTIWRAERSAERKILRWLEEGETAALLEDLNLAARGAYSEE